MILKQNKFLYIIAVHLIAIFLITLNISAIKIVGFNKILPLFDLMAIFYFTIFRNVFSLAFILLLGIWGDALEGNILGINALCYILLIKLFLILNNRMIIAESFKQIWQQFAAFSLLFLLLKLLVMIITTHQSYDLLSLLIKWILSVIFYVVMHRFFDRLSRNIFRD